MKNKLIVIGWLGAKKCFLNVTKEEALRRYKEANPHETHFCIEEHEFEDEFGAYDISTDNTY